jgi:hypothetical protein
MPNAYPCLNEVQYYLNYKHHQERSNQSIIAFFFFALLGLHLELLYQSFFL